MLSVGSLFSGVGGLELGLERAGMQTRWQVEYNDFAQRVLAKHWPDVPRHKDVRDVGRHNLEPVDVICGGFPCQPHSDAGLRGSSSDERDLWPEFARIVGEIRPRWVVAENVPGLLTSTDPVRGADHAGAFFGRVLSDLAALGYDAEWHSIRASDFGAIHRRERVFIIAYPIGKREQRMQPEQIRRFPELSWGEDLRGLEGLRNRPDLPESLISRTNDGLSQRMDRLGNAVVPQMAQYIGECIMAAEAQA